MMVDDLKVEAFTVKEEREIVALIRRNLESFDKAESVLVATFRRLENLDHFYQGEGCRLFVAKNMALGGQAIACAGLGPLHGLPLSEGIGEIRDLVVEEDCRGKGLGSRLLRRCIEEAKSLGYQRLYLETSKNMVNARKLFLRSGFRPVTESSPLVKLPADLPCYFLMEDLQHRKN